MNLKRLRKNAKKGIGIIPRDDNPEHHALRMLSDPELYKKQEQAIQEQGSYNEQS